MVWIGLDLLSYKIFCKTDMGPMVLDTGEWESLKRQKVITGKAMKSFDDALHNNVSISAEAEGLIR